MSEDNGMHVSGGHCRDCGAVLDGRSHRHWCPSAQTRTLDVRPISGGAEDAILSKYGGRGRLVENILADAGWAVDIIVGLERQLDVSAVSGDDTDA